jgi:serine/threonine-protein kinase
MSKGAASMSADEQELIARAERRIGTVLRGKYRVDRVLGAGGMAVVYQVTHRNQAEFAIKMLHTELSTREDVRTRFLREGYAANSVKHPGVVLVVDDDVTEDGAAFLVMELLQGASLDGLLQTHGWRLPVPAILSVADQLLEVLEVAHEKGIVHRDVKPANLFVTGDGTVKVLDFGIARVRDAALSSPGGSTGAGMLLGTPAFMAPEQAYAMPTEIDGRTDIWATGATLFTLVSGQSVHQGENAAQLMIRAATMHARPLQSVVAEAPAPLAEIIDRALAFEKDKRWPDAAAMRAAVERVSLELFGHTPDANALRALLPPAVTPGTRSRPPRVSAPVPATPVMRADESSTTARPLASTPSPGAGSSRRKGIRVAAAASVVVALGAAALVSTGRFKGRPAPAEATSTPEASRAPSSGAAELVSLPTLDAASAVLAATESSPALAPSAAPAVLPVSASAHVPLAPPPPAHATPRPTTTPGTMTPPAAIPTPTNPLDIPIK